MLQRPRYMSHTGVESFQKFPWLWFRQPQAEKNKKKDSCGTPVSPGASSNRCNCRTTKANLELQWTYLLFDQSITSWRRFPKYTYIYIYLLTRAHLSTAEFLKATSIPINRNIARTLSTPQHFLPSTLVRKSTNRISLKFYLVTMQQCSTGENHAHTMSRSINTNHTHFKKHLLCAAFTNILDVRQT